MLRIFRIYLIEAAGLFGFVLLAGLLAVVLEHPGMPGRQTALNDYPVIRRALLGLCVGLYTFINIKLSKASGAHNNPSISISYYILGRMKLRDLAGYILAQFAGATLAAMALVGLLGSWFSHPMIHYGATRPQPPHSISDAFIAEWIISFITMIAVLLTSSSKRLKTTTPLVIASLLALFLTVELPYSGMSMNPARSFAGDVAANDFSYLWIYILAPVSAMLAASALYLPYQRWKTGQPKLAADHLSLPAQPPIRPQPGAA